MDISIDKVYIDRPCELLKRRSIDRLFAEYLLIRKFPGPIVLQTFELGNPRAQPYFIRIAPIGPIYKSESCDSLFQKQNTG